MITGSSWTNTTNNRVLALYIWFNKYELAKKTTLCSWSLFSLPYQGYDVCMVANEPLTFISFKLTRDITL